MEQLFKQWAHEDCLSKNQLTQGGSNRVYYRLEGATKQCVATVGKDVNENEAFFHFAKELRSRGINVPEVYAISDDRTVYLQQDLGNVTLYTYLTSRRAAGIDINNPMRDLYRQAIDGLLQIQLKCSDVDFSHSYPRDVFDRQSIYWDLNYFKYYFVKLFHIPFDEQLLEQDFTTFTDYLLDDDYSYFMFRDYQSRNIMINDDKLYYIDFQGARRGPAQYDLASLLYSAKSEVPDSMRAELLEYYIDQREKLFGTAIDRDAYRKKFYAFVLARMMQAMGAYGYRGVLEKKEHFVKSIPLAVHNLQTILKTVTLPINIPHLHSVWQAIADLDEFKSEKEGLTVSIFSFSYRKGIPFDKSGNGGGYVFDCRALPNPGLYEEYKSLTGRDTDVIRFFEEHSEVEKFLADVRSIVGFSVKSYLDKGYTRLMVNFGCTGGRHRSVYCAEQTAKFLSQNYDCKVTLHHLEQSKL